ncbi:hypothetical protein [Radiobacillus deserti]|uniref:hypothetical protein n=1 Tax=Radiobacillus deserti TaxID=2594883 RepID=UPI00188D6F74|nr:hypothetical protein [Radiobacillus deserti]
MERKSGRLITSRQLILGALLSSIAALFQSAGAFIGIGYALSMLATLPILVAAFISIPLGVLSYMTAILLLGVLQPSELWIFPFTTGLLGLGIGIGFKVRNHWVVATSFGAIFLMLGISVVLYGFSYPILGPISSSFSIVVLLGILGFSFFYSWLWVIGGIKLRQRIQGVVKAKSKQLEAT